MSEDVIRDAVKEIERGILGCTVTQGALQAATRLHVAGLLVTPEDERTREAEETPAWLLPSTDNDRARDPEAVVARLRKHVWAETERANIAEGRLSRVTDLFEKWAAEEDEHRQAGEYGIAEGLSVAIEELREAVHGAVREESEPEPVTGGSCPSCDGYEAALADVESRLQTTTQAYAITAERLGNARKAIKRYKEQRDDARVRVQLLVKAMKGKA